MKLEEVQLGKKKAPSFLPIAIAAVVFPASILFWVGTYLLSVISNPIEEWQDSSHIYSGSDDVTPSRWLLSLTVPVALVVNGLRKKSLNISGAFLALFVGFFLTLSSYCFFVCLIVFFLTSSKATKFRTAEKQKFEEDFKEGGQRNWIQVICNGGMATELAILYLLDVGSGERAIDFAKDYRASWLGLGILGSLACSNGDTWASELGSVIRTTQTRLITSWRIVPPGTNGGITLGGLAFSGLGGLAVGLGYYLVVVLLVDNTLLMNSPNQYPLIVMGLVGGLLGSVIDSLLGATLQFSGSDPQGKIVEIPGPTIKRISGFCVLDNHSINLISTIFTGLLLPSIANSLWDVV